MAELYSHLLCVSTDWMEKTAGSNVDDPDRTPNLARIIHHLHYIYEEGEDAIGVDREEQNEVASNVEDQGQGGDDEEEDEDLDEQGGGQGNTSNEYRAAADDHLLDDGYYPNRSELGYVKRVCVLYARVLNMAGPVVVGRTLWKKRGAKDISVKNMLTPSDEALIDWIIDNYWNEWASANAEMSKLREKPSAHEGSIHYGRPLKEPYFIVNPKLSKMRRLFGGTSEAGEDRWNYYYNTVEDLRQDPMFPEFDSVFKTIYTEMYGTPRNRETEQGANQQGRRVRARNGFVRRAAPAAAQPPQGPALQVPNNVDVASVQNQEQV